MFSATEFVYVERNANSQDVSLDHVKNPTTETKIGDKIHRSENKTQFVRAEICDGSAIVRYVGGQDGEHFTSHFNSTALESIVRWIH